jgi:hypothetical protein
MLNKVLIKRETKKNKGNVEEKIENNLAGLFHYLTAPNIRNKVKHPFLLLSRFSNCTRFYYNPSVVPPTKEVTSTFTTLDRFTHPKHLKYTCSDLRL